MAGRETFSSRAVGWILFVALLFTVAAQAQGREEKGNLNAFQSELERKGFAVNYGQVQFPSIVDLCCQCKLPNCYGNNASSTYGFFALPPAPNQDPSVVNPYSEWFAADGTLPSQPPGWSFQWRLRQDEAVVFIGPTPPKVDYYGFTGYVYDRYCSAVTHLDDCVDGEGVHRTQPASAYYRFPVFSSLGDTINPLTIRLAGGRENPYEKNTVVVMAADQGTEQKVRKALFRAGYPEESLNFIALPPSISKLGLAQESDSFMIAMRVAPTPGTDVSDYYDNGKVPKALLRITPQTPVPAQKLAPVHPPKLRVRGTGKTETSLLNTVDTLGQALASAYPGFDAQPVKMTTIPDGYNCLENMQNCLGDNRDTVFIAPAYDMMTGQILPYQPSLKVNPGEFLVCYGVIHPQMKKATYSNISIMGWGHKAAPRVVHNDDMVGSGWFYLQNTGIARETADQLYAYRITREGGCDAGVDGGFCVSIGTECTDGIALDEVVAPVFRAYLEPATKVGPAWGEVILDRILKFTPKR